MIAAGRPYQFTTPKQAQATAAEFRDSESPRLEAPCAGTNSTSTPHFGQSKRAAKA
jgi:hypothetical protein